MHDASLSDGSVDATPKSGKFCNETFSLYPRRSMRRRHLRLEHGIRALALVRRELRSQRLHGRARAFVPGFLGQREPDVGHGRIFGAAFRWFAALTGSRAVPAPASSRSPRMSQAGTKPNSAALAYQTSALCRSLTTPMPRS